MTWWWLSFTDDTGNLGCCVVAAEDQEGAVQEAWAQGCNPGGEVMMLDLTQGGRFDVEGDPESPLNQYGPNRLIPIAELLAAGEHKVKDLPPEEAEIVAHIEAADIPIYVDVDYEERG